MYNSKKQNGKLDLNKTKQTTAMKKKINNLLTQTANDGAKLDYYLDLLFSF